LGAPAAEGHVRLRRQRGDPDTSQVEPPLIDDEPPLPQREELPVEEQEVVELEVPLQPHECPPLESLQP
jgi:hypothetical protein